MKLRKRKKNRPKFHKPTPTPDPEATLEASPLRSGGIPGPLEIYDGWKPILHDEHRRSFVGCRKGAFSADVLKNWWHMLATRIAWRRPTLAPDLVLPRSAAWLTQEDCTCRYKYSSLEFEPLRMEPWFRDIMETVCRTAGITDRPNSCNANYYDGGMQSVGWHSDDEPLFDACSTRDVLILSLSLGATRCFELHAKDKPEDFVKLPLDNGDLCTMEGLCQKHYRHRVPRQKNIDGPRINLTWRWVLRHERQCPHYTRTA